MAGGMRGKGHTWQGCVCSGGGMCGRGACVAGGHVWQGACVAGGLTCQGACEAGQTATAADGTHPTGMHSCG